MPSGKVHYKFWKIGWIGEGGLFLLLLFLNPLLSFGSLAGYFLGQFVDPDLDLVGITSAEGRMLRKIPLVGGLFVAYWTIYGAVFRQYHRSFLTHGFIISTVIRFIYAFWWIALLKYTETWFLLVIAGMFIGLLFSDSLHIWVDNRYGGR